MLLNDCDQLELAATFQEEFKFNFLERILQMKTLTLPCR